MFQSFDELMEMAERGSERPVHEVSNFTFTLCIMQDCRRHENIALQFTSDLARESAQEANKDESIYSELVKFDFAVFFFGKAVGKTIGKTKHNSLTTTCICMSTFTLCACPRLQYVLVNVHVHVPYECRYGSGVSTYVLCFRWFQPEDLARAIVQVIATDIATKVFNKMRSLPISPKQVFFCGNFVRHPLIRHFITLEFLQKCNEWSYIQTQR